MFAEFSPKSDALAVLPPTSQAHRISPVVRMRNASAVVQLAHFIPRALQPTGDWWFACDEEVGLHFCPTQFMHAKAVPQPDERWPRLLFYALSDAQRPVLILEADGEREPSRAT